MTLEEFAEDVRRQAHKIMGASMAGQTQRCGELAAALCTLAAQVKTQAKMQPILADPDRYDLATLPAASAFDE